MAIFIVVLAAGAAAWFQVIDPMLVKKEYTEILAQVTSQTTLEEQEIILQSYIESHPPGPHTLAAEERIKEIFDLIQKREFESAVLQVDALPVDENYKASATAIYTGYLDQFPDGIYAEKVRRKQSEIPSIIDNNDYTALKAIGVNDYDKRIVAYHDYLQEHPDGQYREEVELLQSDMCEIYYRYLKKEVKVSDQKKEWERGIWLCDKFITSYEKNPFTYSTHHFFRRAGVCGSAVFYVYFS